MAEGGIAAALANVDARDNWQVHFRDTIRGGKLLNDWRMAHCMHKRPTGGQHALKNGGHCLTARKTDASCNATLVGIAIHAWRTSVTAPASR